MKYYFRCECGKPHMYYGLGPLSVCSCGRTLWRQAYPVDNDAAKR